MNEGLGSRPLVAWTQFNYAVTLLRRRADSDEERARRLLEDAIATADKFDMVRLQERARAVLL
jgi:hypothetical protein